MSRPLTVDELIAALSALPEERRRLPVAALYDVGCAYGSVVGLAGAPWAEDQDAVFLELD